jgi:hypothetical protein|tara:strand:+ start:31006 stop:31986 length:981 start_codon:yes stop_codon:yes gene_type:complete
MIKYKHKNKRKFVLGGNMYTPNELTTAQNPNSPGNPEFEVSSEENASAQADLDKDQEALMADGADYKEEFEQKKVQDKLTIENEANKTKSKFAAVEGGVQVAADVASKALTNKAAETASKVGATALTTGRAANLTVRANQARIAGNAGKAARLTARSGRVAARVAGRGANATKLAAQGSKLASGAKTFLSSGAGIGTVAAAVGMGVSALSDDKDATKWNAGEVTGSLLQGAGTGASVGSVFGPVGTAAGAIVGGLWSLGKGLVTRNKSRKLQAKQESIAEEENLSNSERISNQFSSNLAAGQAKKLKSKTYSKANIGQRYGGLKNR